MQELLNPELFILIPILAGIGSVIKNSKISDWKIPLILCVISIILVSMYMFSDTPITNWESALKCAFTSIVQGIMYALTTVGGHQAIKQTTKNNSNDNV